ncbi:MAG: tetratricopeptide repeat protein, partial [Anaerolineales bacterium]
MLPNNLFNLIPAALKTAALDAVVDFVSAQAQKFLGEELGTKVKKLRSDAGFTQKFEQGFQRALKRFVEEYANEDEDLVAAIEADASVFKNEQMQKALLEMLKNPGKYMDDERGTVAENFASVLPGRKNRERVDKAITFLLRCLAEELWNLPELQPIYNLQFQKMTAEAARQQVELQKAQLQALTTVNEGVRQALLQLTDAIAERKLLPSPNSDVDSKQVVMHNLPQPDYGKFVGREKEIEQITAILQPYPKSQSHLVTIDGIGGIGKSALALEVAHRYLRDYSQLPVDERFEAIIWASAKQSILTADGIKPRSRSLHNLDDVFTAIAVTMKKEDITKARHEEQLEIVRNVLIRQRTLLIIDNLETIEDETVITFLRELPAPTKAIVTTRQRIDVAYAVRLTGMPFSDAKKLIEQECNKRGIVLSDGDVKHLYDRTGGIPLAIMWSIANLGFGQNIEMVLRHLGAAKGDISYFCFGEVWKLIQNTTAYPLILSLALFATSADKDTLGSISDLNELDRDDGLFDLERHSLINRENNRFSLLPLTKEFVKNIVDIQELDIYRIRALHWMVDILETNSQEDTTQLKDLQTKLTFEDERANFLALLDWAIETRRYDEAFTTIRFLHFHLWKNGYWNTTIKYLTQGIELSSQQGDFFHLALFKRNISSIYRFQGQFDIAQTFMEESINIFKELGDNKRLTEALRSLGMIYYDMGNTA